MTPQIVPHIDWVCNHGHILSDLVLNDIVSGCWSFDSETKASKEVITHKPAKMEELRLLHVKDSAITFPLQRMSCLLMNTKERSTRESIRPSLTFTIGKSHSTPHERKEEIQRKKYKQNWRM